MISQHKITLQPRSRGFHLVTDEVLHALPSLPEQGILHLFIQHTSAGLCLNENFDPDVRHDLNLIFDRLVPENQSFFKHTAEGADDMPAHAKSILVGSSLSLPVTHGELNIGIWQGVYLCEFRNRGGARNLLASIWT